LVVGICSDFVFLAIFSISIYAIYIYHLA
jgi:hypothetical protein